MFIWSPLLASTHNQPHLSKRSEAQAAAKPKPALNGQRSDGPSADFAGFTNKNGMNSWNHEEITDFTNIFDVSTKYHIQIGRRENGRWNPAGFYQQFNGITPKVGCGESLVELVSVQDPDHMGLPESGVCPPPMAIVTGKL